jgi:hypothetical protein
MARGNPHRLASWTPRSEYDRLAMLQLLWLLLLWLRILRRLPLQLLLALLLRLLHDRVQQRLAHCWTILPDLLNWNSALASDLKQNLLLLLWRQIRDDE